ncbi:hypothetical protein F8388_012063 [Cannabis sativa]|uniref:CCHC-type domain-containing protein n=1 Tax=Cannabis sativa TaxID=3483 RepID=A0A7J6GDX0_CANSA|nr:hypothetical protein G4B88_000128 [Cannabis sativa]KAF4381141.1 hypothetical protein F8388_012063 [Cannabis sativa]
MSEFDVARFWVEFHGLPTRFLSDSNIPILAKKVGQLIKPDGKKKEEVVGRGFLRCWIDVWISYPIPAGFFFKTTAEPSSWVQFKYEKLPFLCFNCGRFAHEDRECLQPTAWVNPVSRPAVKMGIALWKASFEEQVEAAFFSTGTEWNEPEGTSPSLRKGKTVASEVPPGDDRTLHGTAPAMQRSGKERGVLPNTDVRKKQLLANDDVVPSTMPNMVNLNIPSLSNSEISILDFAYPNGPNNREDTLPDIGPTLIQSLEIPHIWTCQFQRPHHFPEPINIRKRKAHTWYHPTPDEYQGSIFAKDTNDDEKHVQEKGESSIVIPLNKVEKFNLGHSDPNKAETSTKRI